MTCSRCPRPAQIRVDERIVLCAECWNEIFERLKADFNSIASVRDTADASATVATELSPGPGVATVAHSFDDGPPVFLRRVS